jgi:putative ABC transport system permease protein
MVTTQPGLARPTTSRFRENPKSARSAVGVVLGWLASYPGNAIAKRIIEPQVNSVVKGSVLIYPTWLMLGVPAVVCLITTLAALCPASRAARVDPVTSLRHE